MATTKLYDLQFQYETGYDTEPRVIAYELYKQDGEWNTRTDDRADMYIFTEEDNQWAINRFDLEDIEDLWVDEFFTTEDRHLVLNNLPPKAIEWVDSLPEYEYEEVI